MVNVGKCSIMFYTWSIMGWCVPRNLWMNKTLLLRFIRICAHRLLYFCSVDTGIIIPSCSQQPVLCNIRTLFKYIIILPWIPQSYRTTRRAILWLRWHFAHWDCFEVGVWWPRQYSPKLSHHRFAQTCDQAGFPAGFLNMPYFILYRRLPEVLGFSKWKKNEENGMQSVSEVETRWSYWDFHTGIPVVGCMVNHVRLPVSSQSLRMLRAQQNGPRFSCAAHQNRQCVTHVTSRREGWHGENETRRSVFFRVIKNKVHAGHSGHWWALPKHPLDPQITI